MHLIGIDWEYTVIYQINGIRMFFTNDHVYYKSYIKIGVIDPAESK